MADCYNCSHRYYHPATLIDPEESECELDNDMGCEECPDFYPEEAAKADAKYGHRDHY